MGSGYVELRNIGSSISNTELDRYVTDTSVPYEPKFVNIDDEKIKFSKSLNDFSKSSS